MVPILCVIFSKTVLFCWVVSFIVKVAAGWRVCAPPLGGGFKRETPGLCCLSVASAADSALLSATTGVGHAIRPSRSFAPAVLLGCRNRTTSARAAAARLRHPLESCGTRRWCCWCPRSTQADFALTAAYPICRHLCRRCACCSWSSRPFRLRGAACYGVCLSPSACPHAPVQATSIIGGRVREEVFAGHVVELGANWVQPAKASNPVWHLAQSISLHGSRTLAASSPCTTPPPHPQATGNLTNELRTRIAVQVALRPCLSVSVCACACM